MKIWKNTAVLKNLEITSIRFAQSETMPVQYGNWVESSFDELQNTGCASLFIQAGVRYFGYL